MSRAKRSLTPLYIFLAVIVIAFGAFITWRILRKASLPSALAPVAVLQPIRFSELPRWAVSDPRAALQAFVRSCSVLLRRSDVQSMGASGYAGVVRDWRDVCNRAMAPLLSADAARRYFEQYFSPVEVHSPNGNGGLFTGYYEPELAASRARHGDYQAPIYGVPPNLVSAELGVFRPELKGERISGCVAGHRLLPCPTRGEIDVKGIQGAPVLFYASDPVALFFLHIQGSGRVRLEDGSMVRVAYAEQNGRPYTAIGRVLIQRHLLERSNMSMQAIRGWMRSHPTQAREIMEQDQSYVFFREQPLSDPHLGSPGSEGVALTPAASAAIDPRIHPLGVPVYVDARRPDADPERPEHIFDELVIAQDTGGAIRGPARADIFWGFGNDAESIAGRMKSSGRFFVLLPKAVAVRVKAHKDLHLP